MPSNTKKRRRNRTQIFIVVLALAVLVGGYVLLADMVDSRGKVKAYFDNGEGKSSEFVLEIARTDAERSKGLMFRKPGELKAKEGMIFVFPTEQIQSFWMKNTYISLDMIFVNRSLEVVGVLKEVPVLNEKRRQVSTPSSYVVELLAGQADKHGIKKGSKLVLLGDISNAP